MTGDFLIVKKYLSNPLVTGTIFLTLAGTTSRFMGFFFRIFLNNVMGSTGLTLSACDSTHVRMHVTLLQRFSDRYIKACCRKASKQTDYTHLCNNYVSHHCSFAHNYYVFQCQLHKPLYFK